MLAFSWAALAYSRLRALDLQGEKQPMVYQVGNRTYAITFNGEISNFRELRSELENLGHTFRSQSDMEVLLHAYVEWGETCVNRLNGMFAFGLWDDFEQQLLLVRDRLGIKPLFYAQRGSAILFASELKSLLAHPAVKSEIDATGIAAILGTYMSLALEASVMSTHSVQVICHLDLCSFPYHPLLELT